MRRTKKQPEQIVSEDLPAPKGVVIHGTIEDEKAVETAERDRSKAVQAKPFQWKGQPLHPFAIDRDVDWNNYREEINRPPLGEVYSSPGKFLPDAISLIWFCSVEPREWIFSTAEEVNLKIREWAEVNIEVSDKAEVYSLALQIINRAYSTKATSRPTSSKAGKY